METTGGHPRVGDKQTRVVRRRNRPALSCGHCRFRKLRCNRASPCESCVKSGDRLTCVYEGRDRNVGVTSSLGNAAENSLASRVDRLEALLVSAMSSTPTVPQSLMNFDNTAGNFSSNTAHKSRRGTKESNDVEQLGKEFGILKVDPSRTVYHGGQHWVSSMFQIKEFRDYLEAHSDELGRNATENKKANEDHEIITSLIRGTGPALTREELLAHFPSQAIMDMLIVRFFSQINPGVPVIHEPTFRQEYADFCANPRDVEMPWLGLLFSILHLAELFFDEYGSSLPLKASVYGQRTVQCLISGHYTNPKTYTIESLVLYIYAEWMDSQDRSIDVSLLLGISIRLAMKMGLHRDSRKHDAVGSFQGEMRRRVWAVLCVMDITCSFQLSLPNTINHHALGRILPRNIYKAKMYKDMKDLPPARPLNEVTEISSFIQKTRLAIELAKITEYIESEDNPSQEDLQQYESSLEDVRKMIPQELSMPFNQDMNGISAGLYRPRIDLDRIYQLSKCILHRTSLARARHDPVQLKNRGKCIDAAMMLLSHQQAIYSQLDTSSFQIRKQHLHTVTTHDFYHAAMAVALDLHYGFEAEPVSPSASDVSLWGHDRREEMIATLDIASGFCARSKDESVEAANAHGMLSFVVMKARKAQFTMVEQGLSGHSGLEQYSADTEAISSSFQPDTEIFQGLIPDFDWNLWNQFNGNLEDDQNIMQWSDPTHETQLENEHF